MGQSTACCNDNTIQQQAPITRQSIPYAEIQINQFLKRYPSISAVINRKHPYCPHLPRSSSHKFDEGTYIGQISNSQRNGEGIMLYHQGFYYQGEWKDGQRSGCGRLIDQQGEVYQGQWQRNQPNGEGTYEGNVKRRRYAGSWVDGQMEGKGSQYFEDGSRYQGDYQRNIKQGKGRITYPDGSYYQGDFQNNEIQGFGVSQSATHRYEGSWKAGKMEGAGKSEWYDQNGEPTQTYIGQYRNGIKDGFGEYRWKNGRVYKGEWIAGKIKKPSQL